MSHSILYLHGMGGSPADWRWVNSLLPGISLSIDDRAESPEACATSLATKIARDHAQPFVLCGYSMGGRLAILTAEKLLALGHAPSALALVSSGLGSSDPVERQKRIEKDNEWARLAERDPAEFWRLWYEQELFASYRALPSTQKESWTSARSSLSPASLARQLRTLGPASHDCLRPALERLGAGGLKVLYLVGELDKKYQALSREVEKMAGLEIHSLGGAGHILPLEAPAALAAALKPLLQK